MCSQCSLLMAVLGLLASAPWLAGEEPRYGQLRLIQKFPAPGKEEGDWYRRVSFSADGRRLLLVGGKLVRLYDIKSGKEVTQFTHEGELAGRAVLSPNGKLVATTFGSHEEVLVFDTASKKIVARLPYKGGVGSFAFSPDGETILSSDKWHTTVDWWDTTTWKRRRHLALKLGPREERHLLWGLVLAPDGKLAAVEVEDSSARLCDLTTGIEVRRLFRPIVREGAPQLAFSPNGRYLAADAQEAMPAEARGLRTSRFVIHLWDVQSGQLARDFKQPLPPLPDTKTLMRMSSEESQRLAAKCRRESRMLAFSPDGKTLANACSPTQLWEVATGQLRHEFDVNCVALSFSPDGRLLATTEFPPHPRGTGCAYLWDWRDPLVKPSNRLTPGDRERLWGNLASADASVAYRAIAALLAHPQQAVASLGDRLRRVEPLAENELNRRIAELDSDNFSTRERAGERLAALGDVARPFLLRVKSQRPSLEMRRRVEALLARLAQPGGGPEPLRCLRAVEVLETVGTEEARRVLAKLAGGAAGTVQTEDAKAALNRLKRR